MEQIILFSPLLGAVIGGFFWKYIGEKAAIYLTIVLLFASCFLSWIVFLSHGLATEKITLFRWIVSGNLSADWSIRLDRLTSIMLVVVTSVSALVHLYSVGYMAHDENWQDDERYKARFFAYLSFFTFAMLMLVTSDNLVQMFFGWEGVGVASYLLIGFYYKKQSANAAAIKAFVVNRVGDFGFALGIFALFMVTGSINFDDIFVAAPKLADTTLTFLWTDWNAANLIAILLFIGAMGKSAQLFLHTWLPDAMEGPTPVSALIHAATMVTAGVFLVCRMSPLMEYAPAALGFITIIGAFTAFVAATIGLVQNDIKRVIAYSTMSQLGYMFVAAGVGAYSVAMFHLFTHAFFKAMLFLGAGSVIHAMHHEQDMRNYGGLRKKIPYTFWAMMIGTLAITGVGIPLTHVGFAGFLSKDAVIESAWAGTNAGFAFWTLVIAALLTSFYSWRLMLMTFFGQPKSDSHAYLHAKESPMVMLIPLGLLGLGAILSGMIWYSSFFGKDYQVANFFGIESEYQQTLPKTKEENVVEKNNENLEDALPPQGAIYMSPENHVLHDAHYAPIWVKISPFIAMLLGLLMALWFYVWDKKKPSEWASTLDPLYRFLLNKWYFDEIYEILFVSRAKVIGQIFWKKGDGGIIDGSINGIAMSLVPLVTRISTRLQSGYIFSYALAMVLGILLLLTWMIFSVGVK